MDKNTAATVRSMLARLSENVASKQEVYTRDHQGFPLTHRSMMSVEEIEDQINDIIERIARETRTEEEREDEETLRDQDRSYLDGLGFRNA